MHSSFHVTWLRANAPAKNRSQNSSGLLIRDEGRRKVHEGQVVPRFHFPADEQRAKAIVPPVRSLDNPAPGLPMHTANQGWLALLPNVGRDAACAHCGVTISKRVALVETAVARAPNPAPPFEHDRIERRGQGPFVVEIRAAQHDRERDATPLGQEMALRAELRPVGWVRSREIPPFGAFTITESNAPHCH